MERAGDDRCAWDLPPGCKEGRMNSSHLALCAGENSTPGRIPGSQWETDRT